MGLSRPLPPVDSGPENRSAAATIEQEPRLTHRQILRFFFPLALSWIFMSVEGPVSISVISRLPAATITTAAFNILMGLALWLESPVIDLLSTSTTLARNRRDYRTLSRFVVILLIWVTVIHGLITMSPLYWLVTEGIMRVPHEVAEVARPGLIAMLFWSAFIGWRRYLQGILIRFGRTRVVGIGTAVRVTTMILSSLVLYLTSNLSGILIVAIALMCAVGMEAIFVHLASRPTIRKQFLVPTGEAHDRSELNLRALFRFHLPLTATTMVTLIGLPIISAALARTADPVNNLAGFQVAFSLLFLMRTVVFALPEVVITLYKDNASAKTLKSFSAAVGLAASVSLLLIAVTGLDRWFFIHVIQATPTVARIAHLGFLAGFAAPFIGALQSYVRGMLTAHHLTGSRFLASLVSLVVLVAGLAVGIRTSIPGVVTAGLALTVALLAELGALVWSWRLGSRQHIARGSADSSILDSPILD